MEGSGVTTANIWALDRRGLMSHVDFNKALGETATFLGCSCYIQKPAAENFTK